VAHGIAAHRKDAADNTTGYGLLKDCGQFKIGGNAGPIDFDDEFKAGCCTQRSSHTPQKLTGIQLATHIRHNKAGRMVLRVHSADRACM
jgi:hypothetical protein